LNYGFQFCLTLLLHLKKTPMERKITGLHHVTAICSNAQTNVDFYAGILGLRMVKKTVNFDAPDVYHLYYGDELGQPGTIMTFFPFHDIPSGKKGKGQLTVTSFSISENSLDYWMQRLDQFQTSYKHPQERFGSEVFIYFEDPDGLGIELVANKLDQRPGFSYGQIPAEHAIKGFYGVAIEADGYERTDALLTERMDHKLIAEKSNRFRYSPTGKPGDLVDIVVNPVGNRGLNGSGTVHHLAFATPDDAVQLEVREQLLGGGLQVTGVMDRQYFHSIYFREPGGVLFEVATSDIGFTLDEPKERLGEELMLPPWQERQREAIENGLSTIDFNWKKFL
jgi:glyoxalase family protein